MFELCIAIACLCMWLCIWALSRILKRQGQDIRNLKKYIHYNWMTEDRCDQCKENRDCPAYNTQVLFPCPHFKEED